MVIEVTIPYAGNENEIKSWCSSHIGCMARYRDHVGELYPWYASQRFAHTVFMFNREPDAFLFKLRWL